MSAAGLSHDRHKFACGDMEVHLCEHLTVSEAFAKILNFQFIDSHFVKTFLLVNMICCIDALYSETNTYGNSAQSQKQSCRSCKKLRGERL